MQLPASCVPTIGGNPSTARPEDPPLQEITTTMEIRVYKPGEVDKWTYFSTNR